MFDKDCDDEWIMKIVDFDSKRNIFYIFTDEDEIM